MIASCRSIRAAVLATCTAASAGPAAADPLDDPSSRGWTLAVQLCSQCHVVGREGQVGQVTGPAFFRIANMPSTTGLSLNVFLQSHHQQMPSLRLDRDEMNAVIDYILSLKVSRRH